MTDTFDVAFICTGNQARSPLAEGFYRAYTVGMDTTVTSYGTADVGQAPPLPLAVDAGARLGVDISAHRARALGRASLSHAELVLGFEPFHVAAAVVDGGASPAGTFLLAELVALLAGPLGDAHEPRVLIASADAMRVRSRPDANAVVVDPLGKEDAVMTAVAKQVEQLVRLLVDGLFGSRQETRRTPVARA